MSAKENVEQWCTVWEQALLSAFFMTEIIIIMMIMIIIIIIITKFI